MNGFLIAALVILLASILWGCKKGFIRIAFSLIGLIVTIVLVAWITPYVSDALMEHTKIYENLTEVCTEKVKEAFEEKGQETTEEEVAGMMQLPGVWMDELKEKIDTSLEEKGTYQLAGEYIAGWIIKGITFLVAFVIVSIVLKILVKLLDLIAKLPVLNGLNRLLGGITGLIQGMLIIWILMFVAAVACTTDTGRIVLENINESPVLLFFYEHNALLQLFHLMF